MQIAITSPLFDYPVGSIRLHALSGSAIEDIGRRSNRVATLDGGAVFNDSGYSAADRTLTLIFRIASEAQWAALTRLVKLYPFIHFALRDGYYSGNPQQLSRDTARGQGKLVVLLEKELS